MILSVTRDDERFSSMVKQAIAYNLFIEDWTFEELLKHKDDNITRIAMAYNDQYPVGIAMTWFYPASYNIDGEHIGVYVSQLYRGAGLGRLLINSVGGVRDRYWLPGVYGSEQFFVRCQEYD